MGFGEKFEYYRASRVWRSIAAINHIYAQVIDDDRGLTLVSASTPKGPAREQRQHRRQTVSVVKFIPKSTSEEISRS